MFNEINLLNVFTITVVLSVDDTAVLEFERVTKIGMITAAISSIAKHSPVKVNETQVQVGAFNHAARFFLLKIIEILIEK